LTISPARIASFQILLRTEKDNAFATELLHAEGQASMSGRDHRLTTELVFGVLRNQTLLDWYFSRFSKIPLERLDTEVKMALRLGVYQILMLARVPVRAAISESVELVKTAGLRSAAGFVNAVLRRVNREGFQQSLDGLSMKTARDLSVRYSHPEWLVERWVNHFDLKTVVRFLTGNNLPPRTFFRSDCLTLAKADLLEELRSQGIQVRASPFCDDILEIIEGDLQQMSLLREHKIVIQDAGSQLIPYLLNPEKRDLCLDLCAAPGGKSSQIAQITEGEAKVVAMDVHWHRARTMRRLHGGNWPNLWFIVADGTRPLPLSNQFDKVLVDAPCSGTGTLGRHPEIRWRVKQSDLTTLPQLQIGLLETAACYLKPGGLLVYSTCSLEPEENEKVIESFLAKHSQFCLDLPSVGPLAQFFDRHRHFRLLPSRLSSDGFFAGLLRKSPLGR
jgi:16S rRNA (cytosine967-C5)-methyltransferase